MGMFLLKTGFSFDVAGVNCFEVGGIRGNRVLFSFIFSKAQVMFLNSI